MTGEGQSRIACIAKRTGKHMTFLADFRYKGTISARHRVLA